MHFRVGGEPADTSEVTSSLSQTHLLNIGAKRLNGVLVNLRPVSTDGNSSPSTKTDTINHRVRDKT